MLRPFSRHHCQWRRQQQEREAAKLAKQRARELAAQRPAVKPVVARPAAVPKTPVLVPAQRPMATPSKPAPAAKPPVVKPSAPKPVVAPATRAVTPAPIAPISTASQAKALTDQITRERQRARDLMTRELYQRGLILYRQQQYANAIEQFQRALEMDPNHRESQQYLREAQTALARGGK